MGATGREESAAKTCTVEVACSPPGDAPSPSSSLHGLGSKFWREKKTGAPEAPHRSQHVINVRVEALRPTHRLWLTQPGRRGRTTTAHIASSPDQITCSSRQFAEDESQRKA
jgi:hypothetical protein